MRVTRSIHSRSSSTIDRESYTNNSSKVLPTTLIDTATSSVFPDTTLNTNAALNNTDLETAVTASFQPTSVISKTAAMTVTTSTSTTTRQSDKKVKKHGFLSSLLANDGASHSISSGTEMAKKKTTGITESSTKYKLFKPWGNSQDSEYKTIEKAYVKFQSKDRSKVDILKTIVNPWLKKHNLVNATDKSLQQGRLVLLKWNEFEDLDRIGPIPPDAEDSYMGVPIDTIMKYRSSLMTTLHYAIDRLNQKGVYSNVISFCARVLGFALLQALPVCKSHIRRILKETVGEEDPSIDRISEQNDKISTLFPEHLKILCFLNLRTWLRQFENAKRIWGDPPIEMTGNWIRRWQSDDSELFFSFYKHYHIVLKSYIISYLSTSTSPKLMTPPFQYITAPGYVHLASFFLLKIESLIHRNIHTITTVIQFEHARNTSNFANSTPSATRIPDMMNPDASAIGMGSYAGIGMVGNSINNEIANDSVALEASMNGMGGAAGVNTGKPKVLEMAGRRFVETMVSIVENGIFQEMCNVWVKAVVKRTNLYDVEGVFCLLDFIDTLVMELDTRDNAIISSEPTTPNSANTSVSSDSSSSPFSPPNLTNILDITFYISLINLLLNQTDHTITILRTISFVYTQFSLLTSQPAYLKQLVKQILLDEETFERMFCHWSRNVRIYFMRLLIWRVGRIGSDFGKSDESKDSISDSGLSNEEDIDILITLQNRLDNTRQCHEFLSNYDGNFEDIEQVLKAKIAESTDDVPDFSNSEEEQSQTPSSDRSSLLQSSSTIIPESKSSTSSNKSRKNKKKMTLKDFISSQSSSGKAAYLFRLVFSNGSNKNSSHIKSGSTSSSVTEDTMTRATNKQPLNALVWHYSPHRHIYVEKAIAEYEAVSQEYTQWCTQLANIERGVSNSGGLMSSNSAFSIVVRFPSLAVEYPKYFGNGIGNSPIM
ncbi:6060_t:CDS:10 [Dentiscutata erythropus]|uniref:6060_t:CDS:1 n=1 Tax=Dentiscutata erythropus TaxID=1348616 RepID=A0A9N9BXW0_9GLOM|nr:6060_t:CDS:10 [Dentiscutata erythropus]